MNGIDLSRQNKYKYSPTNELYKEKLEEDDGAAMFIVSQKQQKTVLNFSQIQQNNINNGTSNSIKFIEWSKRF